MLIELIKLSTLVVVVGWVLSFWVNSASWTSGVIQILKRFNHEQSFARHPTNHRNITTTEFQSYEFTRDLLWGAEAFVEDDEGSMYTGLVDGRIVKIFLNDTTEVVARIGPNDNEYCRTVFSTVSSQPITDAKEKDWQSFNSSLVAYPTSNTTSFSEHPACSRPLGLAMHNTAWPQMLFVVDVWQGLLAIDLRQAKPDPDELQKGVFDKHRSTTGGLRMGSRISNNVQILATASEDRKHILFADGIDFDQQGDNIYFTSMSLTFGLDTYLLSLFEEYPSGKLYRYSFRTGKTEVIADGLWMPNGVVVSHDGNTVLVVQTSSKVLRLFIDGPRKGQVEDFLPRTGILFDNIVKVPSRKTYLLAGSSRAPKLVDLLESYPFFRQLFRAISPLWVHDTIMKLSSDRWAVVECNESGEIVRSIGGSEDLPSFTTGLSEARIHGLTGDLWLGTYHPNQPLRRIPAARVKELFPETQ